MNQDPIYDPLKKLIIIPIYNEEESIISLLHDLKTNYRDWDILVVNDGSTDRSGELVERSGLAHVVHLPFNLGIGGCVQTGFRYAAKMAYDICVQVDGDGQHPADKIRELADIVLSGDADVAIGSRFNRKNKGFKTSPFRRVGIKLFEFLSYFLIQQRITDHTSGFRVYNRKTFVFLAENYPSDYPEPEVIVLLGKNGFILKESFTQMKERQGGVSSISLAKGPYYMLKVMLSMFMAAIRSKSIKH
jgi:glycosyltransferase involved in cell wall biosynthesis